MQHHIDEFSVTDIRHTLSEVWRVVAARRWYFIFPFCLVSSLAMLCSLLVPRQYSTDTLIKREQDVVFAKMLGKSWTQPYDEIRERMPLDLQDAEFVSSVLEEVDLPEGAMRFPSGDLTPESAKAREAMAKEVIAGLAVDEVQGQPTRQEVFRISLTMATPEHAPRILEEIRDKYMALAQARTMNALLNVRQFFLAEIEQCRTNIAKRQKRIVEYELKYPGIDPESIDPTNAEYAALVVERVSLEREVERGQMQQRQLQLGLEAMKSMGESKDESLSDPSFVKRENPRCAELRTVISDILHAVANNKTLKFQTEEHPEIQLLRQRLVLARAELEETPKTIRVPATLDPIQGMLLADVAVEQRISMRERQLAELDAQIADGETELDQIQRRLTAIDRRRALTSEHREAYLKLTQEVDQLREDRKEWQTSIGPIDHVLYLEGRNRSIHFGTVREVAPIVKPSAPDATFLLLICLAIGTGVGALSVLLAELCDRSYRTVKQLTASLGVPVVESIDEILTERVRRRRLLRNLLLMPTLGLVLVLSTIMTGAVAYLSIENPAGLEIVKSSPLDVHRLIVDPG